MSAMFLFIQQIGVDQDKILENCPNSTSSEAKCLCGSYPLGVKIPNREKHEDWLKLCPRWNHRIAAPNLLCVQFVGIQTLQQTKINNWKHKSLDRP